MPIFKNKFFYFLLSAIAVLYCYVEAAGTGDFYIFMSAAGSLKDQNDIYQMHFSVYYNYFYSVLFAIFLKVFYGLPFFWMKFYWLMLNMLLYFHLFRLMATSSFLKLLSEKQKHIFLLSVFVFSFRFFHENIHASQITILILWCCVYGLYLIKNQKNISGSVVLALGINIKLLPILFLPYLFYRGYFKAFILTLLFYLLSLFLPSIIIGHPYNMALLKSWLQLINPMQQRHVLDVDERSFHSLSTLLSTLLVKEVPDAFAMNLKRNIADITIPALGRTLLIVRLALASLTLYFLKSKPFVKNLNPLGNLIELSYILLLIPLIFPHQQHYAFLFIVPAFAVILFYVMFHFKGFTKIKRRGLITLLTLIYLVANLKILLGEYNGYYEHYKILTYAALLLIPFLIWVSKENQRNSEVFKN